jgi:hypothetical protein
MLATPFGTGRQDRCRQPAGGAPRQPGGHRAAVAVPGRRGPLPPQSLQQVGQFLPGDLGQRAGRAEPGEHAVQYAGVAAAGVRLAYRGEDKKASAAAWTVLVSRSRRGVISRSFAPPQQMYRITCPSRALGGGLPFA